MSKELRGEEHTAEEWEKIKNVVLALYTEGGPTLREVANTIANKHGFRASVRQYKHRIKTWDAQKSRRQPVKFRKASVSGSVTTNYPDATSGSTALLAPARLVMLPPQSPGQLKAMDLVTLSIHDSFQSAQRFMLAAQVQGDSKDRKGLAVPPTLTADWALGQFYLRAQTISALMTLADFPGRARSMEILNTEMQDLIDKVIDDLNPSPINVICILQICCRFWEDGQIPLLRVLLRYIGQRAALRTRGHPLHLLCDALLDSLDVIPQLALFATRQAVETSRSLLEPLHPQTLSAERGLHSALITSRNFSEALELSTHSVENEAAVERDSPHTTAMWRMEAATRRICCEISMNRLDDTDAHLRDLTEAIEAIRAVSGSVPWIVWYRYLDIRGELLHLQEDPSAEDVLKESYDVARSNCQLSNFSYIVYAQRHLTWIRKPENHRKPFQLLI